VEFTNIFDNQIDFARVDYLALEYMLVTAEPPPPPTVVSVRLAGGAANVGANIFRSNWYVSFRLAGGGGANSAPIGNLDLTVRLANSDIPQLVTGDPLNSPALVAAATQAYTDFFTDPDVFDTLPLTIHDNGSFGTHVKLVSPPGGTRYPSQRGTLTFIPIGLGTINNLINGTAGVDGVYAEGVYNYTAMNPNALAVVPTTTWDAAFVQTNFLTTYNRLLSASEGGCWGLACANSFPLEVGVPIELEALMSDASVVPLGKWQLKLANLSVGRWPSIIGGSSANDLVIPMPFPNNQYAAHYDGLAVIWPGSPPLNAIPPHSVITPVHNAHFHMGADDFPPYDYTSDPRATSSLFKLFDASIAFEAPPAAVASPRRALCAPRYERSSHRKRKQLALVGSTPTYDNLVQIICDELEVDRTAGAYSTQLLAVVPFNFAALTTGYYEIRVPVNSLVWRRLADVHLRTLTFGLFNGLGELHPSLLGQPFNVTLGLRYL
jgi:hypothetical protein